MIKVSVKALSLPAKKALLSSLRWIALATVFAWAGIAQDAQTPQTGQPVTHPAVHGHRPTIRDSPAASSAICAQCVRDNLSYLAGPELHGRGSGTEDERTAAEFIADKLKSYGLAPAAGDEQYIQTKEDQAWNVLGKIEGTTEKDQIILLSAHFDHLGVKDGKTYYGADDDASGTVAVMELARMLAKQPRNKRTIVVALWGSEEKGLVGVRYFLQNPTIPLKNIVANLEFEMIGRPDPKLKPGGLWLTGWDRTNLGPALAEHGAKLVGDPRPDQKFFTRSDNYAVAQTGIIAQTVSSYGLHSDYHQTTDTVDKIDFQHLDQAISSMIRPVTWLANTEFKPEWVKGKKP